MAAARSSGWSFLSPGPERLLRFLGEPALADPPCAASPRRWWEAWSRATLLILTVIPAIHSLWQEALVRRAEREEAHMEVRPVGEPRAAGAD